MCGIHGTRVEFALQRGIHEKAWNSRKRRGIHRDGVKFTKQRGIGRRVLGDVGRVGVPTALQDAKNRAAVVRFYSSPDVRGWSGFGESRSYAQVRRGVVLW